MSAAFMKDMKGVTKAAQAVYLLSTTLCLSSSSSGAQFRKLKAHHILEVAVGKPDLCNAQMASC